MRQIIDEYNLRALESVIERIALRQKPEGILLLLPPIPPSFKLEIAPFAVLELAYVAVFIPRKPHRPLKKPPVKKAIGTNGFCIPRTASATKTRKRTINTTDIVRYCRLR